MESLSFHDWVKQQDPKEKIDHSSWQNCAFGKYMKECHGFKDDFVTSSEGLLAFLAIEHDISDVADWLFKNDEYTHDQASVVQGSLMGFSVLMVDTYSELNHSLDIIKVLVN